LARMPEEDSGTGWPENASWHPSLSSSRERTSAPRGSSLAPSETFESLLREVASGALPARRRSFGKGEVVFHEGDLADSLHVINSGRFAVRCEVRSGGPVTLSILGRPDIFGEFGIFSSDHRRTATVLAVTSAQTVMVPEAVVKELFDTRPDFATALIRAAVHKGDESRRRLIELVTTPAKLRVLRALIELSAMQEEGPITITQSDLASLATTTRATANQVLQQEQQRGTILLSRGRVRIVDVDALTRRANVRSAAS
jgi:CRP/FNR family transcriptional regulator, cyclic AMP receptor protein